MPTPAGQLDLFTALTIARPTQRSCTGIVEHVARRLGYAFAGCCQHCGGGVVLPLGTEWGPAGWLHRDTGRNECDPRNVAVRAYYNARSIARGEPDACRL